MTLLGLDLGTLCGWCVLRRGDDVLRKGTGIRRLGSGTWDLSPAKGEHPGLRYVKFRDHLEALLGELGPNGPVVDRLVYEDVRRHEGTHAAHVWGGLAAGMHAAALEAGLVAPLGVEVAHVKRRATGRGNADKAAMVAAATPLLGRAPIDDNEADALFVALLGFDVLDGHESTRAQKRPRKAPRR